MAKSEFLLALNEISELRKLSRDVIAEALEQALISAYRRDSHAINAQRVEAKIDLVTNQHVILIEKEVVEDGDEDQTLIPIERALQVDPNTHLGEMLMVPIEDTVERFGRIAAQTAKQVISQKIREAERTQLYDEFKQREGELASAQIQSVTPSHLTLTIDRAEANMPRKEMIPGERYRVHDKIRVLISEVKKSSREPAITVSRANKNMLRRLLEYEVPEIYNKQVEIKSIAREAGHRSKVAVAALQPGVDPLGACVGPRGMRIQNIVRELNDEKIDVIPWSADQAVFIQKALSPAQVSSVFLEEDIDQGKTALVIVPDNQLSLAIGREGQNARLAAKLTGWRIDIKSVSDAAIELLPRLDDPTLAKFINEHADVVTESKRILDKKRADRTVMPEEYATLGRFVQMTEQKLLDQRNVGRVGRHKAMDKIRSSVPAFAFKVPLSELNLTDKIQVALKNVDNLGDLILHFRADTEKLQAVLEAAKTDEDAITIIDEAIQDRLNLEAKKVVAAQAEAAAAELVPAPVEAAAPAVTPPAETETAEPEEELPPAFVDIAPKAPIAEEKPRFRKVARPLPGSGPVAGPDAAGASDGESKKGKDKKDKGRFRELVYDEDRGQVVAKRKRKDGRGTPGWFDDEDDI